jgi:predicted nuclease of predicted toxin-antitoxin system
MKILLDENLPVLLKDEFPTEHKIFTVVEMKWKGKKNGILLEALVEENFNCFITADKNLAKQQHLSSFALTIFLLDTDNNKIETLKPLIREVIKKLNSKPRKGVIEIKSR